MADEIILVERDGPVALVTLNRPDALNALSRALRAEIVRVFTELKDDAEIRAVVLTGAGRAFTAGVDLKEAGQTGFALGADEDSKAINILAAIEAYPWPVIGAINGFAITGGFELALMCDVLLASENAKFADTHARVGILPGGGMTARLPQLVGAAMARRLSMTGEVVDAAYAERIGLVTEVVAHDRLLERAVDLAAQIADVPRPTMRSLKEIYTTGASAVTGPALAAEQEIAFAQHRAFDTLEIAFHAVAQRNKEQIRPD